LLSYVLFIYVLIRAHSEKNYISTNTFIIYGGHIYSACGTQRCSISLAKWERLENIPDYSVAGNKAH
jgi:hypothetical protein